MVPHAATRATRMDADAPATSTKGDERILFRDGEEYAALACRVLRIDRQCWRRFIEDYTRRWTPQLAGNLSARLGLVRDVYAAHCPHRMPVVGVWQNLLCPVCLNHHVAACLAKRPDIIYGVCSSCGHGVLLAPRLDPAAYSGLSYYRQQGPDGVGYQNYAGEKAYRERKARRLLEWAAADTYRPPGRFIEIGSGFGFTRKAAEDLGWRTEGVDLNPFARQAANELYGFETVTGNLHAALAEGVVQPRSYDLVLYQFVLEHIPDPVAELCSAAQLLSSRGCLFLLVPSMVALELTIFGPSYRSLRADHLHLFSWRSLDLALYRAGLRRQRSSTECGVHLLSGFLDGGELANIYRQGSGPDMLILAGKE